MQLTKGQIEAILKNSPSHLDKAEIMDGLVSRGYQLEGVDMKAASARVQVTQPTTPPKQEAPAGDFRDKAANTLDAVFGGGKIGEAIGTKIAKARATDDERQYIDDGPSAGQVAGDAARVGLNFAPLGKMGAIATRGAAALGIGKKTAKVAGNAVAGGATGAGFDVADDVAENRDVSVGAGAAIGAGLPVVGGVTGAVTNLAAKGAAKAGSEVSGALTGTSAETLEQAFIAARNGGEEAERFTQALRGNTTPEALVGQLREQVGVVSAARSKDYKQSLATLGDQMLSTAKARTGFLQSLKETSISIGDDGLLDFSKNKLRTSPQAQSKLQQVWSELQKLPEKASLTDIDTTRQAIKDIALAGDDASANLANKLIDDAVRSVRKTGEQVKEYGAMLDRFGETSEFLDELNRGLSSGDRATIDQTYRRMATALKTNNEQRMKLVQELDEATDGSILSQISGQQLSEAMPRGIFRQIAAGIAGGAVLTGGVSTTLLPALVLASPRVSGELVRALGIGARKSQLIIDAVDDARGLLIKSGAIVGTAIDPGNEEEAD